MICRIQSGLRALTEQFCARTTVKRAGKELVFPRDGPSHRVELPYAYLMVWFTLHYPVLIQPGEEPPEGERHAHLCRFENSQWVGQYLAGVRMMVSYKDSYSLFRCFLYILGTEYDGEFQENEDNHTSLRLGTFRWLVSIRPSHFYLEPYLPGRFVR